MQNLKKTPSGSHPHQSKSNQIDHHAMTHANEITSINNTNLNQIAPDLKKTCGCNCNTECMVGSDETITIKLADLPHYCDRCIECIQGELEESEFFHKLMPTTKVD